MPYLADNAFQKINEPLEVRKKKFSLADAGIAFNSPYPPMLRAERGVDIILSFDFSARKEDDMDPLEVASSRVVKLILTAMFPSAFV